MLLNFSSVTTEAAGHEATVMTGNFKMYRRIHRCTIPNWVAVNVALIKAEAYVLFTAKKKKNYVYIYCIFLSKNTPFRPSR